MIQTLERMSPTQSEATVGTVMKAKSIPRVYIYPLSVNYCFLLDMCEVDAENVSLTFNDQVLVTWQAGNTELQYLQEMISLNYKNRTEKTIVLMGNAGTKSSIDQFLARHLSH